MNALIKKIFPIGLVLLLSACAHYSRPYYPDSVSYGGGYTVVQRDYYQGIPNYGHYSPGRNHFHDVYRPRWQADYGRPSYPQHDNHYSPGRNNLRNTQRWGNPRREHTNSPPRKEDRRPRDHAGQQRFQDGSRQRNRPDHTAPAAGRFNQRQFGGIKNDNRNQRREDRGMPNRSDQQRGWNGDRQQHGNRGNDRRMTAPGQERRQRPDRGNPRQ